MGKIDLRVNSQSIEPPDPDRLICFWCERLIDFGDEKEIELDSGEKKIVHNDKCSVNYEDYIKGKRDKEKILGR